MSIHGVAVEVAVEIAEAGTAVAAEFATDLLWNTSRSGHRHGPWPGVLGETLLCV